MSSKTKAKPTAKTAPAERSRDGERITALENAVRILATAQFAPNGGGAEHVEEARALYAALVGEGA